MMILQSLTVSRHYFLSVLELIPYFGRSPVSYASYPLLRDAYISFDIEISIKPESPDGKTYLTMYALLAVHWNYADYTLHDAVVAVHIIGPIPWGHSGPLCHALSLSSSLSMSSWTSMRRRHVTVLLATSAEWA